MNIGARKPLAVLAFCLVLGMVLSVIDRTDASWDLQNYHLYAPYAALHGRLGMDWFAGGFQGYLNPTEDIPYYIVKMVLFPNHPVVVAALAGLPFGFLVFVTLGIARAVLPGSGVALAAAILGLTGATILSEVGTTYDDILIADFVLSAVWLVLMASGRCAFGVAGFFLGCAVGLKFTAVIYVPGFVLLFAWKNPSRVLLNGAIVGAFSMVGFLAVWGWWGWELFAQFGNPFFPMLGRLFPKSALAEMSFHDSRFFPRNVAQWLFYPFYWLQGRSFVVLEEPLRDPRFALVYIAFVIRMMVFLFNRKANLSRKNTALMIFFVTTYVVWLIGFSILRYELALEAISGIVIFVALSGLLDRLAYLSAIAAITIFALIFTKPVGWGRIGYGKSVIAMPAPTIAPNSVVFMAGGPLGYVVPYLNAPSSAFLSLAIMRPGSAGFELAGQRLAAGDNVAVLTNLNGSSLASAMLELSVFGEGFDERHCVMIMSPIQKQIRLCQLRHKEK